MLLSHRVAGHLGFEIDRMPEEVHFDSIHVITRTNILQNPKHLVAHFEDAIETNARIGARPYLARSQHEYARMLIERGDSGDKEKAKEFLTEATATYRELGMPTFLEEAETLLEKT